MQKSGSLIKVNLQIAFYLFMLALPFQVRYIFVESENQYAMLSLYGFDLLFIWVALSFIVWWKRQRDIQVPWPLFWLCLAIIGLVGLSSYWTKDHNISLYYWIRLMQAMAILGIASTSAIPTKRILQVLVTNGFIQAGFILWQSFTQTIIASKWLGIAYQAPEISGVSVVATTTGRWLRAYGTMPHPNTAAGLLVISILAAIVVWKLEHNKFFRIYAAVGALASTFALFLTFSRGAIIILAVMSFILLIQRYGASPLIFSIFLAGIIATGIFFSEFQSRLSTEQYTEKYSIEQRQSQFQTGWDMFKELWPFGTGIGTYTIRAENNPQPVHFLPLLIAAETGFIIPILLYYLLGWSITRIKKSSDISVGLTAIIIATLGLGFFDHYFWTLPSMLILWFLLIGLQFREGHNIS